MDIYKYFNLISKMTLEKYNDKNYLDKYIPMMQTSFLGFLCYYREWIYPILHNLFLEIEIFIENRPLREMVENKNIDYGHIFCEDGFNPGISSANYFYDYNKKNGSCIFEQKPPELFCSTVDVGENDLLNTFTHEFNHLLKTRFRSHGKIGENGYWLRDGLHYFTSYFQDGFIHETDQFEVLDECINVFQTSDIMKKIRDLQTVENLDFSIGQYLKKLDLDSLDEPLGYTLPAVMFHSLWEDTHFSEYVNKPLIYGNIESIEERFNQTVQDDLFATYADSFDELESLFATEESFSMAAEFIRDTTKLYRIKEKLL